MTNSEVKQAFQRRELAPQRGFRFLHSTFFNSRYSIAEYKTLPREQTAQEFIVTKVSGDVVYYRPVYRHSGIVTNMGAAFTSSVVEFWDKRVLCAADDSGAAVQQEHSAADCFDSSTRGRTHSGLCAACVAAGCGDDRDGSACRVTGEVRS